MSTTWLSVSSSAIRLLSTSLTACAVTRMHSHISAGGYQRAQPRYLPHGEGVFRSVPAHRHLQCCKYPCSSAFRTWHGIPDDLIRKGIEAFRGVPGRLERIENGRGIPIFVDYAHTPDALRKTLETLKRLCSGRLIALFGCGGDQGQNQKACHGQDRIRPGRLQHHHV